MVALDTISQLLYIVGTMAVLRISERLWTFHLHKGEECWRGALCLASEPNSNANADAHWNWTLRSESASKIKCGCRWTIKLNLVIHTDMKLKWTRHSRNKLRLQILSPRFKYNASVKGHESLTCKSEPASKRVEATNPTENIRSKIKLKFQLQRDHKKWVSDRNRYSNC